MANGRIGLGLVMSLALALCGPADAQSRGVEVTLRASEAPGAPAARRVSLYGTSHALVIGIDKYAAGWPSLQNAVADARAVADELKSQGFAVTLKTNLGADELRRELRQFFAVTGRDREARLLLWYAGQEDVKPPHHYASKTAKSLKAGSLARQKGAMARCRQAAMSAQGEMAVRRSAWGQHRTLCLPLMGILLNSRYFADGSALGMRWPERVAGEGCAREVIDVTAAG